MSLNFKLSFDLSDFEDDDFLEELEHVYKFYNNLIVLEYKLNKERRKIRKETKRTAKQYKFCEKLLKKAYTKYNNISDYEFCIGGEITYIK